MNVTKKVIDHLIEEDSDSKKISIYFTTNKAGKETNQNHIRYKNELKDAYKEVEDLIEHNESFAKNYAEAKQMIDNQQFWQNTLNSVAVFISEDTFEIYHCASEFGEFNYVADDFYVKPLFEELDPINYAYMLEVSDKSNRLIRVDKFGFENVSVKNMPESIEEVEQFIEKNKDVAQQEHSVGDDQIHHGQGVAERGEDRFRIEYYKMIDRAIKSHFDEKETIILVTDKENIPLFEKHIDGFKIANHKITGNYSKSSDHEIAKKGLGILDKVNHNTYQEIVDKIDDLKASNKASIDLQEIAKKAFEGRIDTLLVSKHDYIYGRYDVNNQKVFIHEERSHDSVEVLDWSTKKAFKADAKVYVVDQTMLKGGRLMAALLRY